MEHKISDTEKEADMATKERVKFQSPKGDIKTFDYTGISFFKGDKDRILMELNNIPHTCLSFSHFIRVAVNEKLASLGSKLKITER